MTQLYLVMYMAHELLLFCLLFIFLLKDLAIGDINFVC